MRNNTLVRIKVPKALYESALEKALLEASNKSTKGVVKKKKVNEILSDSGAEVTDSTFIAMVSAVVSAFSIAGAITWYKDLKSKAKATPEVLKLVAKELIKKGADKEKIDAISGNSKAPVKENKKVIKNK